MGRIINIFLYSEGNFWVLEDVVRGQEQVGFHIYACWRVFSGTWKVGSWWQDAELDGLQFWYKRAIILLTYVTKKLQKAQLLELTVFISSVIYTGSLVTPWTGLHSPSYGVFLAIRSRHIAVPAILMLEALWLDGTELFYWLLATRSFLPTLEKFPVC